MRKVAAIALLTLAYAGVAGTAPSAQATTVSSCQYRVTVDRISVWEKPANASPWLKYKDRGDVVGGYCDWTYFNDREHREYLAVATADAADDIGWVNRALVSKL
jgi:hypothetical protein